MSNFVGRGITVAIAATYGTPVTVSAITQANPGVATATAHGQADATVGYLSSVEGMVNLEGQAVRVNAPATNTFEIGLNTTNFPAFTGSATFTPVATWATLGEARSYEMGGGSADKIDVTTLLNTVKQEENGLLAAQSFSFEILAQDVPSAAMQLCEDAALTQEYVVVRITLANGAVRVFRGQPSLSGESVQQGAAASGSLSITVKGVVLRLAA